MSNIFDVAKLAGVSIKTVSRVINNEPNVRATTREKVQIAIDQLDYAPHKGAQMMRSSKSGIIGVITGAISSARRRPFLHGLSSIHILRGIQEVMRSNDKVVMIADTQGSADELEKLMQTFVSHSVDGIIYVAEHHQQIGFPLHKDIPVVLANAFDSIGTASVVPDDLQGQYDGIKTLIQKGHKKIAMIGLNEELVAARLRKEGFYNALHEAQFKLENAIYMTGAIQSRDSHFSPLPQAVEQALDFGASAIAFGNDLMALTARNILMSKNVRIPDDVSMLGFDNDIAICETMTPSLSTMNLPYLEIGQYAAARMLRSVAGEAETGVEKVACQFVERDSTPIL